MAILELRGFKVLPPRIWMTGSLCGLARGRRNHGSAMGRGAGSGVLAGATDGGGKLLCRWSLALRGRFLTVSVGRHKTDIKPSGIDQTVPK